MLFEPKQNIARFSNMNLPFFRVVIYAKQEIYTCAHQFLPVRTLCHARKYAEYDRPPSSWITR